MYYKYKNTANATTIITSHWIIDNVIIPDLWIIGKGSYHQTWLRLHEKNWKFIKLVSDEELFMELL